ncbi:integrase [Spirochaetia bacterium]|nr:integrase [Spirochaetia bacterium]
MGLLRTQMVQEMVLQGYSQQSIKVYTLYVQKFAQFFNKKPTEISELELRQFFAYLYTNKSPFSIYLYYNALLFFYSFHNMNSIMKTIPRPKRPVVIPAVLSQNEIKIFLNTCSDLKYKAFFTLIYSSGLRLTEGLMLKVHDIDFDRKLVHVNLSKGLKERYSIIGENTINLLKEYIAIFKPTNYLFYNGNPHMIHKPMGLRSTQSKFQYYFSKTNINKKAHIHTLRHSFATHLLENNVNIFYIMQLLGHSSINTTLIYLHMQRLDLLNIASPIDTIGINFPQKNVPVQLDLQFFT